MTIQPKHKKILQYSGSILALITVIFGIFGSYYEIKSKLMLIETNQAEQRKLFEKYLEVVNGRLTYLERVHIK